jgi:membrane protease subunit HflC
MKLIQGVFFITLAVGFIVLSQSLYTVDETEQAIVLQLGQPVGDGEDIIKKPGLHFKFPLIQDVRRFDSRILAVDPEPKQMVVSSSLYSSVNNQKAGLKNKDKNQKPEGVIENVTGEPIIVDVFARYKISDPLKFLKTLRTEHEAKTRIEGIVNDATRSVLGNTTLRDLLSAKRTQVMANILERVNKKTMEDDLGIDVVDVRIVRADLTQELRQSTVRRMQSELRERATETRAKGEERALEIRSSAEKDRQIILAKAERDAQIHKGEGDNIAIETYAKAFNRDKEFYEFLRSMEAYNATLSNPETRLILSPDSRFLRYLTDGE